MSARRGLPPRQDTAGGTTHFGYEEVPVGDKAERVRGVFDSVARRYDLMNDVMSAGLHRLWKRFAVHVAGVRSGERVLDLASGTADLAALMAPHVGADGLVVASDINAAMLRQGRMRLTDRGLIHVRYALADAERLPFDGASFDCVTIGFGLRNCTDKAAALAEMARVLRPGGRLVILEFSTPTLAPLRPLYDLYSFRVLPLFGRLFAGDAASYRYLAESIRVHPDQSALAEMIGQAGLERCEVFNLTAGVVAVHRAYRLA